MIAVAGSALVVGSALYGLPSPSPQPASEDAPEVYQSQTISPYGSFTTRAIDWPPAGKVHHELRAILAADTIEKLDAAALPVLLPSDGELASNLKLYVTDLWYSASMTNAANGSSLEVFGTRSAYSPPPLAPPLGTLRDTIRGKPAEIRRSEGIWALTWEEYGAAYILKLDCDSPANAVCANDQYLRFIAETLVLAGGHSLEP